MIKLTEVNSTNEYIKEHEIELDDFECVYTSKQTKGKGRTGHSWESEPNKNAAFSLLIRNDKIIKKFNVVSVITAVIVADYLENLGLENVSIKWPNDIYIKDRKIVGILLEGNLPNYMIAGIGINVNQTNFQELHATSIKNELEIDIDPFLVAVDISDMLIDTLKHLDEDEESLLERYMELDYLANKTISLIYNNEQIEAKALGIDKDGSLKISYNNNILKVSSGEVSLVRKK